MINAWVVLTTMTPRKIPTFVFSLMDQWRELWRCRILAFLQQWEIVKVCNTFYFWRRQFVNLQTITEFFTFFTVHVKIFANSAVLSCLVYALLNYSNFSIGLNWLWLSKRPIWRSWRHSLHKTLKPWWQSRAYSDSACQKGAICNILPKLATFMHLYSGLEIQ